MAIAVGIKACEENYRVVLAPQRHWSMRDRSEKDNSSNYIKQFKRLISSIDELGYVTFDLAAESLLQLLAHDMRL